MFIWCGVDAAVRELEDKYVISLKPNPAELAGKFNPDLVRENMRTKLDKTRDCVVEIVLKDTSSIENDPPRLESWTRIVREEIDRLWG